jgi:hypothetical protein
MPQPVYPISDEWFGGIPYEPVGHKYPSKHPVRTPSPVSPRKGLFPTRSQVIQGRGGRKAKKSPVGKFPKTPSGAMQSPPPGYLSPNQYDLQHLISRYGRLKNIPGTSKKLRTPSPRVSRYVRTPTPEVSAYETAESDVYRTAEEY